MGKVNPQSTQLFLESIKRQQRKIVSVEGIKVRLDTNVFPPQSNISISSKGLLRVVTIKNKSVLDVGTGSGIQAIRAVKEGARCVVAVDVHEEALQSARYNFKLNKCVGKIKLLRSNLFSSLGKMDKFDVIVANLPFLDYPLYGVAEATLYDPGMMLHHHFLKNAKDYLTSHGKIIIPHANKSGPDAFIRLEQMFKCYNLRIVSMSECNSRGYLWRVYVVQYEQK